MTDIRTLVEQALRDHAECSGCDVEALAHAALFLATENTELKRQLAEAQQACRESRPEIEGTIEHMKELLEANAREPFAQAVMDKALHRLKLIDDVLASRPSDTGKE